MNDLLQIFIAELVIPEVAAYMRRKPEASDAEVIAAFEASLPKIREGIERGRAFLAETAPVPPPGV